MLLKTGGIVIKNTKYSDSSIISKIYCRNLGMQSFMINGIRSPKAAIKPSLLQPLTILDLVIYKNNLKNIQRIKEARPQPLLQNLHFDVRKSAIGLYVAELLHRAVMEEEKNTDIYDFTEQFIVYTDAAQNGLANLPLFFTVQLTRFLGFYPQLDIESNNKVFLLSEGRFADVPEAAGNTVEPPHSQHLAELLEADLFSLPEVYIPKASRIILLQKLMDYYALHLPGFFSLRSVPVLTSLMKED